MISPEGFKIQQALKFSFPVTNNVAEYEALVAEAKLAIELEVKVLDIFVDSQLVAKQVNEEFKTHNDRMMTYLQLSKELLNKIPSWRITHVAREENQWADALSKLAYSFLPSANDPIYVEEKHHSSIGKMQIHEIHKEEDWRTPILEYIIHDKLPEDKNEARYLVFKARNYCEVNGKLYRRSMVEPLLRCLGPDESNIAILEVHSGICGEHLGGKNLAFKIIRQGLYWPTMRKDCEDFAIAQRHL